MADGKALHDPGGGSPGHRRGAVPEGTYQYSSVRVFKGSQGTDPDPEQKGPVPLIGCGGHGIYCL